VRRLWFVGGLVAVAVLLTAFAGVRVFAPTDALAGATGPYPAPARADDVFYGELLHAPLFVADRIRVYGAANRVWADGPVDAAMTTSAYWALRRWPAQLVGLAVVADRVVVSQWSDGEVIGQRPDTGAVAWRTGAGARATAYQGRRTGAVPVYDPPDLVTATASGGRPVVVVSGHDAMTGLDADTGAVLWHAPGCPTPFTAPGVVACPGPSTVDIRDAGTGTPRPWPDLRGATRPVGCAVGRSECTGLAGDGTPGWLIGADGAPSPAAGLTSPGDKLVGHTVVRVEGGDLVAYEAVTGTKAWSVPADGAVVLAVERGVVHTLVHHDVVTRDLSTGYVRSRIYAHVPDTNDKPWVAGYAYAHDGYVVIERVLPGIPASRPDAEYYYAVPSLVLTGT
jgi:outer membrane protein assembly factor BamB